MVLGEKEESFVNTLEVKKIEENTCNANGDTKTKPKGSPFREEPPPAQNPGRTVAEITEKERERDAKKNALLEPINLRTEAVDS